MYAMRRHGSTLAELLGRVQTCATRCAIRLLIFCRWNWKHIYTHHFVLITSHDPDHTHLQSVAIVHSAKSQSTFLVCTTGHVPLRHAILRQDSSTTSDPTDESRRDHGRRIGNVNSDLTKSLPCQNQNTTINDAREGDEGIQVSFLYLRWSITSHALPIPHNFKRVQCPLFWCYSSCFSISSVDRNTARLMGWWYRCCMRREEATTLRCPYLLGIPTCARATQEVQSQLAPYQTQGGGR